MLAGGRCKLRPAIWWSLAEEKLELTYRDTLQHSSIREGERAQKLKVLYSANITQPMHSPFTKEEVLTTALTLLTNFIRFGCSNAILLRKLLADY